MIAACVMAAGIAAMAPDAVAAEPVPVTKEAKAGPTDAMFLDMATTAASASKARKGKPCGAVVIVNKVWKATGTPLAAMSAEEDAIKKTRMASLGGAVIYTVNEPTTDAYNAICRSGAEKVVFVNPREVVVETGIYPASAYDDSRIDASLKPVPMVQVPFKEAEAVIR